jgi:hypothetical protein
MVEAQKGRLSLEVRRRIDALAKRLHPPLTDGETLQSLRAIAVLEDIGTLEAKKILDTLAKGAAEARVTRAAKAALERLGWRRGS